MSEVRSNIPITNLDFEAIKRSLKDYLRSQDQFRDFDFDGSAMSILLDVLAYNTHYNGFYANMVANEAFLDTAAIRQSVVSIAKHLGYTPRSWCAPRAIVDIDFGENQPTPNVNPLEDDSAGFIPRGSRFTTSVINPKTLQRQAVSFLTMKEWKVDRADTGTYAGRWVAENVEIYEGDIRRMSYIVDSSIPDQRYQIPEERVDTRSLIVRVQKSATDSTGVDEPWTRVDDINTVTGDSRVFFLQETDTQRYEIYFGDNIVGRAVENGNVVILEYLVTSGDISNGAGTNETPTQRSFTLELPTPSVVLVKTPAAGGDQREDIESIRFYAPRIYQAQSRAVTAEDYQAIVVQNFADVESVFVYGGEDADPPQYGRVFVSIKPKNGVTLSPIERLSIAKTVIKRRNVVGVTPVVIDADYTYLLMSTKVRYNPRRTSLQPSGIQTIVEQRIKQYADQELEKFQRNFRASQFSNYVDVSEPSILNSTTTIRMQKRFEPAVPKDPTEILNTIPSVYTFAFNNPIYHPEPGYKSVVSSTEFTYYDPSIRSAVTAYIDDDGNGNLRIFTITSTGRRYITTSAGTIDYAKGLISLQNFAPIFVEGRVIRITVEPAEQDIYTYRNQILVVDRNDILRESIRVTVIPENVDTNSSASGASFPFNTLGGV